MTTQLNIFEQQFQFDGDNVRERGGLWSVFDIIRIIGGQKNPHEVWKRLKEKYSDISQKCENLKFEGKGQRNTPACDRQVALEIIGLLPGEVGRKYREQAAKLFLRYLDADVSLATEIVKRSKDQKAVDQHIQDSVEHSKYLESYHGVHGQLKAHDCNGIHHATYNKQINQIIGIPDGTRHEMTRREKLKMTMTQIAGELTLEDDKSSQGWQAVNVAVSAGQLSIAPFN